MNTCRCKKIFTILGPNWLYFTPNLYYYYKIDIHEETKLLIYHVSEKISDIETKSHPFIESKFNEFFDDIEKIRDEKLKSLGI